MAPESVYQDGSAGDTPAVWTALLAAARVVGIPALSEPSGPIPGKADLRTLAALARANGFRARVHGSRWRRLPTLRPGLIGLLPLRSGAIALLTWIHEHDGVAYATLELPLDDHRTRREIVDQTRLNELWAGGLVLLERPWNTRTDDPPIGLPWLWVQMVRERSLFLALAGIGCLNGLLVLVPAMVVLILMDRVMNSRSEATLTALMAGMVGFLVLEAVIDRLRGLLSNITAVRLEARLTLFVFNSILNKPIDLFERLSTGYIASIVGRTAIIRQLFQGALFNCFLDIGSIVILVPAMLVLNWVLSLIIFAVLAILVAINAAMLPMVGRRVHAFVEAQVALYQHQFETIAGIRTVKSLTLEGRKRFERDRLVARSVKTGRELGLILNRLSTAVNPFERLIFLLPLVVGAWMIVVLKVHNSPGALLAFAFIARRAGGPIVEFANRMVNLQEVMGAFHMIASLTTVPPEPGRDGPGGMPGWRGPIEGRIDFRGVDFRYTPEAALAIEGLTLTVPAGSVLGIMGRSGSGKSTITRLLQAFHADYTGQISLDGHDIRAIDLDYLRASVGVVMQENFLFAGTIRSNIAIARPEASLAEVIEAARLAGAEEFIERLPRGYETPLEEGAVNLSGGQRQRLAIARVLLSDPRILVLDEATSALDAETEAIVNRNLRRIAEGRTVIIVSHRLASLIHADAILVLDRGRTIDVGSHPQLLDRCELYKTLWHQQHRHLETV